MSPTYSDLAQVMTCGPVGHSKPDRPAKSNAQLHWWVHQQLSAVQQTMSGIQVQVQSIFHVFGENRNFHHKTKRQVETNGSNHWFSGPKPNTSCQVVPQQVVLGELPSCRFPFGCEERRLRYVEVDLCAWQSCDKVVKPYWLRIHC